VQAGSYLLMDTHYRRLELPFRQALRVRATVISVNRRARFAVADAGLKAFGMDHGEPEVEGATTFFTSDEHVTFVWDEGAAEPRVGDRVWMVPAHVDPTVAYHERIWVIDGDGVVVDQWAVDLRNW
jgi:D-serine deaminase-like pyridoxal phosphate-dependent protein